VAAGETLRAFLDRLQVVLEKRDLPVGCARDALILARTLLRPRQPAPTQIAVIGPTQTGKSTVANILLGNPAAEVSPLAGFTIHPQGFWVQGPLPEPASTAPAVRQRTLFDLEPEPDPEDAKPPEWAAWALPGWQQCKRDGLSRDDLESFVLEPMPSNQLAKGFGECVIWDTPDFDSLAAESYRTGLLGVVALADVFVLVVSKEKYADRSVWNWLDLLAPLNRPLVVCLNKMTPDAVGPISSAILERLSAREAWRNSPLVSLPVLPDPNAADLGRDEFKSLRAQVTELLSDPPIDNLQAASHLSQAHWGEWSAPVNDEHVALSEWRSLLDDSFARLLTAYDQEYLSRPDRFDSFRRATVELLELLELPYVGGALAQARAIVTWPARQIWASGRALLGNQKQRGEQISGELAFLTDELDLMLAELERDISRRAEQTGSSNPAWGALSTHLHSQHSVLREAFLVGAEKHHEQVTREIHAAANELYETLKKSPKLLATLRSARVTTDALALFLAVKTAGIGMHDFLAAPAMFGLTSLLTEGALGSYMHRVAAQLKQRQLEDAQTTLIEGHLHPPLAELTNNLAESDLLGITTQDLDEAWQAVKSLEAGA
jgi:GTPase SAR1 family protein